MTIAAELAAIKRHWKKMGCELEGAWDTNFRDVAAGVRGAQGKTDGSVGDGGAMAGHMGEITTAPHDDIEKLCADIEMLWPNRVNHTCGFHIHTSFSEIDTSVLADKPFWTYFLARWEAWGKENEAAMTNDERIWFWDRLESKSEKARRYCKREFAPVEQFVDHGKRYTSINFSAWHKFRTIEVRFLPMFKTSKLAVLAVKELANIFDAYLTHNRFPEISLEKEIQGDGDMVLEEEALALPSMEYYEEDRPVAGSFPNVPVGPDIMYRFAKARDLVSMPGEDYDELQEP
jgi:hypothetical protein